jgi:hypothetical protein
MAASTADRGNTMVTLCWAAKGGSGTTVVTSTLALESSRPALLVDLAGEIPAVLGLPEPDRPGIVDWLAGTGPTAQLIDLVLDVNDTTALLPYRLVAGRSSSSLLDDVPNERWQQFLQWMRDWEERHEGAVWIDAGTGCPNVTLADGVAQRWLVTRACYLSLTRAARSPIRPNGVVLVAEAGRSLRLADVERSLAAPVMVKVGCDPKMAHSVDSGLLSMRPPFVIRRAFRRAVA